MTDSDLKQLIAYSKYVTRHQSEPSPDRILYQEPEKTSFKVPTDEDVHRAVDIVLADIAPHKHSPQMNRGKTVTNPVFDTFNTYGTVEQMPRREQDIFVGCCRTSLTDGDTAKFSVNMLFMLLKTQRNLNADSIANYLNIKRKLRDLPTISTGHAQKLVKKMKYIIQVWTDYGFIKADVNPLEDFNYDVEPY